MTARTSTQILDHLIEGCKKADALCQELLYKQFYSYAMSICMRYTNSIEDAREVLNDGFMKIFTKIDTFDTSKPFKTWLCRIMINTSISHYRLNRKYYYQEEIETVHGFGEEANAISDLSFEELRKMVERLSVAYRTVFKLYVVDGYTHEEIAELLNISVGTSKSNLSRAREALRKMLIDNNYER